HRAPLSDRGVGLRAGRSDPLQVLTPAYTGTHRLTPFHPSGRITMRELIVDFITSLDGYASGEGWPGFWGLEGPEYLAIRGMKEDGSGLMSTLGSVSLYRSLLRAGLVDRF